MESKRHDRRTNQGVIELINKLAYNKRIFFLQVNKSSHGN